MSIERHPTNGGYRVKYYPFGRNQPCKRVNFATYNAALAFQNALKAHKNQAVDPAQSTPPFSQVVDEYLKWVKGNQSAVTHELKTVRFEKHIIPALGHMRAKDLRQHHLDAYAATVGYWVFNNDVVMLFAMITWMCKRNYAKRLDWSPQKHTGKHKVKNVPHPADLIAIIAAMPIEKHRIMFSLMLYCGLRWNECRLLQWEGVDMRSLTIKVREISHGDEDIIYIPAPLVEWFKAHHKPSGLLFEGRTAGKPCSRLTYMLDQASAPFGLKLSSHCFRHASGTYLYEQTNDIYQVQQHLRHRDIKTSMIYARMSVARRKSAVESIVDYAPTK